MAIEALRKIARQENVRVFEGETRDSIKCAFKRLRDRAGLKDFGMHDLRHEFISRLHEDTDLRSDEMRQITGHKDDRMLERYTHLRPTFVVQRFHESKARFTQMRREKLEQAREAPVCDLSCDTGVDGSNSRT
jgi:integrase